MPNYDSQVTSALRLLKLKGQPMTLLRMGLPNYDPLRPSNNDVLAGDQSSSYGVVLPVNGSNFAAFDNKLLNDPLRRKSLRFVLLAASGLTLVPQAQDILLTTEGPYRLIGATELNPAGNQPILYQIGADLDLTVNVTGANNEETLILDGNGTGIEQSADGDV